MPASAEKPDVDVREVCRESLSAPIVIEEEAGLRRIGEPVTVGIPFPKGMLWEPASLVLWDQKNQVVPVQVGVLARWTDHSVKWALLDFQANVGANSVSEYRLANSGTQDEVGRQPTMSVSRSSDCVEVDTGHARFFLNAHTFKPFERVVIGGTDIVGNGRSQVALIDGAGVEFEPRISALVVETEGPVRVTLKAEGKFYSSQERAFADFVSRISFYAKTGLVELELTIRNPHAARHTGGLWDLGDEGSLYFKDLSIRLGLASDAISEIEWIPQADSLVAHRARSTLGIYQDSSGGENWKSSNHMNRFGLVMNTFQGYRVTSDGVVVQQGERATPIVSLRHREMSISGAIEGFWQNFPKAIEVANKQLRISLFPRQYRDLYELQGGEQKTHTIFLQFDGSQARATELAWVHHGLVPRTTPEWYASSKAIPYLVPRSQQARDVACLDLADQLVDGAVSGNHTFFDRREIIDEYGWRHFGDLYADHEAVEHKGETPLVAHYNNQYDVIYGAIIQYVRSADARWFNLMSDLAKHVIDIDIYHTQEDRPIYNNGMFWHTEHYVDAATATHRTYSSANVGTRNPHFCGGGPSSGHIYTTGLLFYYYLTGNLAASEAVLTLADWVVKMDEGYEGLLGLFDRRPTGWSSSTVSLDYHGPGRGCAHSVSALIDAYLLSGDKKYRSKAEELIQRCIHPCDVISKRQLDQVEQRWSYTVFLQVLGKYLDFKVDGDEIDYMYCYARVSLLHYATWMLDHEVPYTCVLDKVERPTETWPAQDIRKSNVFKFAAKYADEPARSAFLQKADFFFSRCITDLLSFKTCTLTRPLVLLMTNVYMHPYFLRYPNQTAPKPHKECDFGRPQRFTPRFYELYRVREYLFIVRDRIQGLVRSLGMTAKAKHG